MRSCEKNMYYFFEDSTPEKDLILAHCVQESAFLLADGSYLVKLPAGSVVPFDLRNYRYYTHSEMKAEKAIRDKYRVDSTNI